MERRKALAAAGAVSLTLTAAAVALGASFGLFGIAEAREPVGSFPPVETSVPPRTVVVDVPATAAPSGPAPSGQAPSPVDSAPPTPQSGDDASVGSEPRHEDGERSDDHEQDSDDDDHAEDHEVDDD